ncbi:MAG: diphthine--ammonia ligase [Nitrososphaeria archaeon]|nr:diphthine--ammonia ligase [Nitrososphaeria archaeon]NIN53486.1 diphthine--ammonia ligase [Nitrososphaeria archaeon]NIQ34003.1 diphthine--ammonia ligase [Nitrososphaeria archaeon]
MAGVAVSWSGGKESNLSYYKAMSNGFEIKCLLNLVRKDVGRCMSHGVTANLLAAQAETIGVPIVQREATWKTYEEVFKEAVYELKQRGVEGMVFGDIDLEEHKEWVERICEETGIQPIEPLWQKDPTALLKEFIEAGFKAIVVSVKVSMLGSEWLGRRVDPDFVRDLHTLKEGADLHLCGEAGEYHTFVYDGPLFKRPLKILKGEITSENGHLFLDIQLA